MNLDFGLVVPRDHEFAFRYRNAHLYLTERPWLDLYGVRLKPISPSWSTSGRIHTDNSLIHRCLPEELLLEVLSKISPYDLGRASCVCRKWRYTIRHPIFWRIACLKAWQANGVVENYKILHSNYGSSWRKMWLLRPRIRIDGIYVSRNTYIRSRCQVVCYFRYIRFYPSGKFLYKNSSQKIKDVAYYMNFRSSKSNCVFGGRFSISDDKVNAALLYPGMRPTVLRIHLRLRSTIAGANNRMDMISLVTSGPDSDDVTSLAGAPAFEEPGIDGGAHHEVPVVSYKRGLAPFVFVPFEQVRTVFFFGKGSVGKVGPTCGGLVILMDGVVCLEYLVNVQVEKSDE